MTKGAIMLKVIIRTAIVLAILFSIPKQNHVQSLLLHEPIVQESPVGKAHYIDDIHFFAQKYQVSAETMIDIIDCENGLYDPKLQSFHRYDEGQIQRNPSWGEIGDRERSFGLVMLHIPACNTWEGECITYEQAINPEFSINYLARELSIGNGWKWTCFNYL